VSDSPLEIKRMQRLGCNEWLLEEFLLKYTETKKTTNESPYKLQTLWILWGEAISAFFRWWMFWQGSRSNTLPSCDFKNSSWMATCHAVLVSTVDAF